LSGPNLWLDREREGTRHGRAENPMTTSPRLYRRRYRRVPVPTLYWVTWETSGRRQVSRVLTAGLGGMFLSTTDPPPPGSYLTLTFECPAREVQTQAIVRTSIFGSGMGVEFKSMKDEDRNQVSALLKQWNH
jgi:hypothetical protein